MCAAGSNVSGIACDEAASSNTARYDISTPLAPIVPAVTFGVGDEASSAATPARVPATPAATYEACLPSMTKRTRLQPEPSFVLPNQHLALRQKMSSEELSNLCATFPRDEYSRRLFREASVMPMLVKNGHNDNSIFNLEKMLPHVLHGRRCLNKNVDTVREAMYCDREPASVSLKITDMPRTSRSDRMASCDAGPKLAKEVQSITMMTPWEIGENYTRKMHLSQRSARSNSTSRKPSLSPLCPVAQASDEGGHPGTLHGALPNFSSPLAIGEYETDRGPAPPQRLKFNVSEACNSLGAAPILPAEGSSDNAVPSSYVQKSPGPVMSAVSIGQRLYRLGLHPMRRKPVLAAVHPAETRAERPRSKLHPR